MAARRKRREKIATTPGHERTRMLNAEPPRARRDAEKELTRKYSKHTNAGEGRETTGPRDN
jgi:hypothetical protein